MTEVSAVRYAWTEVGMRESSTGPYIHIMEAERLLEEAHKRGFEQGQQSTEKKS